MLNPQPTTRVKWSRSPIRTFSPRLFSHGSRMLATVDCFCSSTETKRWCPHALHTRALTPALAHECPVGNWITRSSCLKVGGHMCYFTSVQEANFSRSCAAPLVHRRTVAYRHESLQVFPNCQWNCPLHSGQSPVHVVALRRFFGFRAVDLPFPSAYRLGRSYG